MKNGQQGDSAESPQNGNTVKSPERDFLDELFDKKTLIKIAGKEFRFRVASVGERAECFKLIGVEPGEKDERSNEERAASMQIVASHALSLCHLPSETVRQRTRDEWVQVMTLAESLEDCDFAGSENLLRFAMTLIGVEMLDDDTEVADAIGADPIS